MLENMIFVNGNFVQTINKTKSYLEVQAIKLWLFRSAGDQTVEHVLSPLIPF